MSCYIVSPETLHTLAAFAVSHGCALVGAHTDDDCAQRVVDLLLQHNIAAMDARYRNSASEADWSHYTYRAPVGVLAPHCIAPVVVLKLAACVDYQCCEIEDYEATDAAHQLRAIRKRAIAQLPGYEAAPWGL